MVADLGYASPTAIETDGTMRREVIRKIYGM